MIAHDTEISLSTAFGDFWARYVRSGSGEGILVVYRDPKGDAPFIRFQSSCIFAEGLGSIDCDCKKQINASLRIIQDEGGYLLYQQDEGRGVGLEAKMRAMRLEASKGLDTARAFQELGFSPDERDFSAFIEALNVLGVSKEVRVATNNPRKLAALKKAGYFLQKRVKPLQRWRSI